MPLLQLMARLRTMATQPDVADLRNRTDAEMRAFEGRAEKAGFSPEQVRRAHYALCASLDDMVLNTPWGARGAWADRPMVAAFHPTIAAGRFFDVLRQAREKVATFRPVLELMYVCLSLGMMGQYRDLPQGGAEIDQIRAETATALAAHAPSVAAELAPSWKGVAAPFASRRTRLPFWVAASLAVAAVAGLYLLLTLRLNDRSDTLFAQMLAATPSHMPEVTRQAIPVPPPPAPPEPSARDRLRDRLAAMLAAGQVDVVGTPTTPVLRLPTHVLFPANSAVPQAGAAVVLSAVVDALKPWNGRLDVIGYTDDRPVRTVLFPSSFKLSAAQAQAIRAVLARDLGGAGNFGAEGRAAADPVASNATPEGRELNRRVEIVLEPAAP